MPVEARPLFRPDVLRRHLEPFPLPPHVDALRAKLDNWATLLTSPRAASLKEQELLPDFLSTFFYDLLGYTGPADGRQHYTLSRERHVEVDGKFADAVLGHFYHSPLTSNHSPVVALEGKGPRDPLDRPFAGRRRSPAVGTVVPPACA